MPDGFLISQAASLRIGIQKRKNETVKRLLHLLSGAVIRAARRRTARSIGKADEQPNRFSALNWAASANPAFAESARRWIRQRYLATLPGVISQFCYFADSWCPSDRVY